MKISMTEMSSPIQLLGSTFKNKDHYHALSCTLIQNLVVVFRYDNCALRNETLCIDIRLIQFTTLSVFKSTFLLSILLLCCTKCHSGSS